jgi:hypothetical protein
MHHFAAKPRGLSKNHMVWLAITLPFIALKPWSRAASEPAAPTSHPATSPSTAARYVDDFFRSDTSKAATKPSEKPVMIDTQIADKRIFDAYADATVAWYNFQAEGYKFRMRAFERQLTLSAWIFVVVVILVLSGVVFAGFQLFAGLYPRKPIPVDLSVDNAASVSEPVNAPQTKETETTPAQTSPAPEDALLQPGESPAKPASVQAQMRTEERSTVEETELQFSPTSFVIKTSILGVVVLAIACAFFFLYLKFVYPIQSIP